MTNIIKHNRFLKRFDVANMMSERRMILSGIGEGIEVEVSTDSKGAESPIKIQQAVQMIFPDAVFIEASEPIFGKRNTYQFTWNNVSMSVFLQKIHEQRILDTALDSMTKDFEHPTASFSISRQAASMGKISFPIPDDYPLGGLIHIQLSGENVVDWIQSATWHEGREHFPRYAHDDIGMTDAGDSRIWYDSR